MQRRLLMIMRRIFMHAPKREYWCNFSLQIYALFWYFIQFSEFFAVIIMCVSA